jgi:MFS family permease
LIGVGAPLEPTEIEAVPPMQTLILSVLGLGLAVALCSPVSVVTVIVLLSMRSGRRRAIAFVVGWLLAIVVIGAVVVLVLHGQDFSSHKTTPSRAASAVEIVLGCIVLLVSARAFRRRSRQPGSAETPKWLDRLDQTNWLLAVLVGTFMLTSSRRTCRRWIPSLPSPSLHWPRSPPSLRRSPSSS